MKIEGSGSRTESASRSESGSISQRNGSVDPDPDPHQNVMDPQHGEKPFKKQKKKKIAGIFVYHT